MNPKLHKKMGEEVDSFLLTEPDVIDDDAIHDFYDRNFDLISEFLDALVKDSSANWIEWLVDTYPAMKETLLEIIMDEYK